MGSAGDAEVPAGARTKTAAKARTLTLLFPQGISHISHSSSAVMSTEAVLPLRLLEHPSAPGWGELGTPGVRGALSPSSDGCAVPGAAAAPRVRLCCHGKRLGLTPAFTSLPQTLASSGREGERGAQLGQFCS